MGYIPPVKDDQLFVYGNRQTAESPLIPGPPAVEEISFFDALKNKSRQSTYFERNIAKERLMRIAREHEKDVTGKGEIFDKSI